MAIRINYADPEAQGLTSCFLVTQGGMKDLVREVYPVRGGTADPYRSGETFKIESVFNGTTDNYNDTSTTVDNSVNPFTVVWESYLDAGAGTYAAFTTYMSARGLGPLILFYTSDPSYSDITMGYSGANTAKAALPTGLTRTGQRHWGVWTWNGSAIGTGSNHGVWINGQPCTVTTSASGGAFSNQNGVGGVSTNVNGWVGGVRQVRFYAGRAWTQADAMRFYNPTTRDSLFKPSDIRVFFDVPAAAPFDGFYDAPIFRVKSNQQWSQ